MNRNMKSKRLQKKQKKSGRPKGGGGSGKNAFPGVSFSNERPGMVVRDMPLFGQRTRRTLPYAAYCALSSGAGSAGAYVFSANGIFDPDVTGVGGQPMGYAKMMGLYNHYTVVRSSIRVIFKATSASAPIVCVAVSGSSTPLTAHEQIEENGRCAIDWLQKSDVAGSTCCISVKCDVGRFQGLRNIIDDPDMRGDASSNPTEQVYYILYIWDPVDNTVVTSVNSVRLEYDVIFHEPKSAALG